MSGITDSAKFNNNSSYYIAIEPNTGGGEVINGNLQITGNLGVGGTTLTTGLTTSGSLNIVGTASLGSGGTGLTTIGGGGLNVTGASTVAALTVSGNTSFTAPAQSGTFELGSGAPNYAVANTLITLASIVLVSQQGPTGSGPGADATFRSARVLLNPGVGFTVLSNVAPTGSVTMVYFIVKY